MEYKINYAHTNNSMFSDVERWLIEEANMSDEKERKQLMMGLYHTLYKNPFHWNVVTRKTIEHFNMPDYFIADTYDESLLKASVEVRKGKLSFFISLDNSVFNEDSPLEKEFMAMIDYSGYNGQNGWIEELYIDPLNEELLDDIFSMFKNKKVKITITEVKE